MSALETLRNALFGNPPSESFKPDRVGVVSAFNELVQTMTVIAGGIIPVSPTAIYANQSTLFGHIEFTDRALGLVYNDANSNNNGIYIKNGAAGAGNWIFTALLGTGPRGFTGLQGKSFYEIAIEQGYVTGDVTPVQFVQKLAGDIANQATLTAVQARNAAQTSASIADQRAMTATAAAQTAAASQQSVLDNIGKVDVAVALQIQAVSRAALAAVSASQRTEGRQAYLSETGRTGSFIWSAANQSARVTADPYQGITVAPASDTSGASGAWLRTIILPGLPGGQMYDTAWWNPAQLGDDAHVILRQISALIATYSPDGSILLWSQSYKIKGMVEFTKPITIKGINTTISRCENADGQNWVGTDSLIRFRASNSGIADVGFAGWIVNANANQPQCVGFQPANGTTPQIRWWVRDCKFERTCVPIAAFAADNVPSSIGEASFSAPKIGHISGNDITTNRYGFLLFGVDDTEVHSNVVRPDPNATADGLSSQQWTSACRLLGCKNVSIHDNDLYLLDYTQGAANSALRLDEFAYNATLRRLTTNVMFQRNAVRGGNRLYDLHDFSTLVVGDNSWYTGQGDASVKRAVFEFSPSGTSIYRFGDVFGEDATYVGPSVYATGSTGLSTDKQGIFRAGVRSMILNKMTGSYPDNAFFRMDFPSFKLVEITRINVIGKARASFDFRLPNSAGVTLIVRDSVLSEQAGGGLLDAGSTAVGGDPATTLQAIFTSGGTSYVPSANNYPRQPAGLADRIYGA